MRGIVDTHRHTRGALQLALGCWLPFVACAAVDAVVGVAVEPIVLQAAAHVRLLVAVPLFVAGERLLRRRGADVLLRLGRDGIVDDARPLERIARTVEGVVGARAVVAALAVAALAVGQLLYWRRGLTHGPAGAWYGWLAFPVFVFVALRYALRWLLWAYASWRIARLPLRAAATHPDGAGGLALVTLPIAGLVPFVLGAASVAAATWGERVARGAVALEALREPAAVWLALALVAATAPYLVFAGILRRTRRRGLAEQDRLGIEYARRFHARWLERTPGDELLGTGDIQSLSDLGGVYRVVRRMRPLPMQPRQLAAVAMAALLPFVAVLPVVLPLPTLLVRAAQTLVGLGR